MPTDTWGYRRALLLLVAPLLAQQPKPPAFEVATIKQNLTPDGPQLFQALPGGRVNLVNQTVRQLIYSSYQTQDFRILGGPDWLSTDRFDISAKANEREAAAPPQQMLLMIRTLLTDRFGLTLHTETREVPIYRLMMARADNKPGPALKPSTCVVPAPNAPLTPDATGKIACGNRGGPGSLVSGGATMDALANRLGRLPAIGRPVVNQTALPGVFDFELTFTPDPTPAAPGPQEAISIFTALQEQLGLKLEATRGPIEVMVIDRANHPAAN